MTERDLTVDLAERRPGVADEFRPAAQKPPGDWPWPSDRPSASLPALWLRYDNTPAALLLSVTVHPKSVSHETALTVQVDRRGIEVQQTTDCVVRFGTLDHLDLAVPAELVEHWERDETSMGDPQDIGPARGGGRLVRLKFARPVQDKVRLKFRFRLPLAGKPRPEHPTEVALPWLRPREGTAGPTRVRTVAELGTSVDASGTNWTRSPDEGPASSNDPGAVSRVELIHFGPDPAPLRLAVTARPLLALPPLVAARLWLRTVQGPEQSLRTTAYYWLDTHEGHLTVALPPGGGVGPGESGRCGRRAT